MFDWSIGFGEIATAGVILTGLYQKVPVHYRAFKRKNRLGHLRTLRSFRDNIPYISNRNTAANVHFGFFLLTMVLFVGLAYGVPTVMQALEKSVGYALLFACPIFIFEFFWLQHQKMGEALVQEHGKLLRYKRFRR